MGIFSYPNTIPVCISEEGSNQKLVLCHLPSEHVLSLGGIVLSSALCVRQGWPQSWAKEKERPGGFLSTSYIRIK